MNVHLEQCAKKERKNCNSGLSSLGYQNEVEGNWMEEQGRNNKINDMEQMSHLMLLANVLSDCLAPIVWKNKKHPPSNLLFRIKSLLCSFGGVKAPLWDITRQCPISSFFKHSQQRNLSWHSTCHSSLPTCASVWNLKSSMPWITKSVSWLVGIILCF